MTFYRCKIEKILTKIEFDHSRCQNKYSKFCFTFLHGGKVGKAFDYFV